MGDLSVGLLISAGFFIIFSSISVFLYHIPIRLSISGNRREGSGSFHACIGWGLIDLCVLPVVGGLQGEIRVGHVLLFIWQMKKETPDLQLSPDEEKSGSSSRDLLRFIPQVKRIVSEMIHHLRIETIIGKIRFGAGDPVTTGLVYGYYQAVRALICRRTCSIILCPDFTQRILEGEMQVIVLITRPFGLGIRISAILLPIITKDIRPKKSVRGPGVVNA